MKIAICVKQVPDTSDIKWTENNTIQREGLESILNPYDLYAIEGALRIKKLFSNVEIISTKKCLIPKDNGTEVFCTEYHCKSKSDSQEVLIYKNAQTGKDEDILLLLYSDNGILTK